MKPQNYKNHIRYYTQHHFVFYPVMLVLGSICVYKSFTDNSTCIWLMFGAIIACITWLSFILRQHYALGNQNRIARIELRFKYYRLTQKRFEDIEQQLSFSQILALRFAPDEELVALVERAQKENLSPDEIKKAIKNWLPDYMRL